MTDARRRRGGRPLVINADELTTVEEEYRPSVLFLKQLIRHAELTLGEISRAGGGLPLDGKRLSGQLNFRTGPDPWVAKHVIEACAGALDRDPVALLQEYDRLLPGQEPDEVPRREDGPQPTAHGIPLDLGYFRHHLLNGYVLALPSVLFTAPWPAQVRMVIDLGHFNPASTAELLAAVDEEAPGAADRLLEGVREIDAEVVDAIQAVPRVRVLRPALGRASSVDEGDTEEREDSARELSPEEWEIARWADRLRRGEVDQVVAEMVTAANDTEGSASDPASAWHLLRRLASGPVERLSDRLLDLDRVQPDGPQLVVRVLVRIADQDEKNRIGQLLIHLAGRRGQPRAQALLGELPPRVARSSLAEYPRGEDEADLEGAAAVAAFLRPLHHARLLHDWLRSSPKRFAPELVPKPSRLGAMLIDAVRAEDPELALHVITGLLAHDDPEGSWGRETTAAAVADGVIQLANHDLDQASTIVGHLLTGLPSVAAHLLIELQGRPQGLTVGSQLVGKLIDADATTSTSYRIAFLSDTPSGLPTWLVNALFTTHRTHAQRIADCLVRERRDAVTGQLPSMIRGHLDDLACSVLQALHEVDASPIWAGAVSLIRDSDRDGAVTMLNIDE